MLEDRRARHIRERSIGIDASVGYMHWMVGGAGFGVVLATDPEGLGVALDPDEPKPFPAALLKFICIGQNCIGGGGNNPKSHSHNLCGLGTGRKEEGMKTVRGYFWRDHQAIFSDPPCLMQGM